MDFVDFVIGSHTGVGWENLHVRLQKSVKIIWKHFSTLIQKVFVGCFPQSWLFLDHCFKHFANLTFVFVNFVQDFFWQILIRSVGKQLRKCERNCSVWEKFNKHTTSWKKWYFVVIIFQIPREKTFSHCEILNTFFSVDRGITIVLRIIICNDKYFRNLLSKDFEE